MIETCHQRTSSFIIATVLLLGMLSGAPGCRTSSAKSITPAQLDAMKTAPDVVIIDVREPAELGSLPSVAGARNIPLGTLASHLSELDKQKRYVLGCRSGNRSSKAAELMERNGFTKIYSLDGGMQAYSQHQK